VPIDPGKSKKTVLQPPESEVAWAAPPSSPSPSSVASVQPVPSRAEGATPAIPLPPASTRKAPTVVFEEPESGKVRPIRGVLVEFRGPADAGRMHALYEGRNRIGRDVDCDVCVEDPHVSKMHGFIYLDGDGPRLVDSSANGTVVDGERVRGSTLRLAAGAKLDIGSVRMVFVPIPTPYGS
jgi:hypothetical protein